ncbi:MAG: sugar transferase [Armatimonas sp.]
MSTSGYDILKRAVDASAATLGLVFVAPLLGGLCLAIRLDSPGPALFRQKRVGRDGQEFVLLKLRTMKVGTPELPTNILQRQGYDPRTRLGKLVRRLSLDELPQLINVLRGEMSLVGPRPALPTQETLNEKRRVAGVEMLLPGITGWAQINGRDEIEEDEKVRLDVFYLEKRSIMMDMAILFRTFAPVLSGKGNR